MVGDVTCGVKDLDQDLMLVGTQVALQCSTDVIRELVIPAQSATGLQGVTRVVLQCSSDVKRELVIPAQSGAVLQAWYRITRARGL